MTPPTLTSTEQPQSVNSSRVCYEKLGWRNLEKMAEQRKTDALIAILKTKLSASDSVLDVGCGYGRITLPLVQTGYTVEGIDITPSFVEEASKRAGSMNLPATFRIGDMTAPPYDDNAFGSVICVWSSFACLLTDDLQKKALSEMVRIIRHGGLVFIENRNGEEKEVMEKLEKGSPNIIIDIDYGVPETSFLHTRNSFGALCSSLNHIQDYTVSFMDIGGQRRLIMEIRK